MTRTETKLNLQQVLEHILVLEAQGKAGEAEAAYKQILAQDSNCAPAWHGLGLLLLNKGDLKGAAEMVMKAVSIDPRQGVYQRNFGEMCRRLGMFEQAIVSGQAAVVLLPKDLDAHFNLALAYGDSGDYKNAIASYRKAIKINPKHGQSWNNLGAAFEASGHMADALKAYIKATKFDANNVQAHNNLGVAYIDRGNLTDAITSLNAAIAIKPDFVESHYNLSSLKKYASDDPHLLALESLYNLQHRFVDTLKIRYNFAIGKAWEDTKQYDRAFAAYKEGNQLQHALLPVNESRNELIAEQILKIFTKDFFKKRQGWSQSKKTPIFIVGMPRSGTTLLEQILDSHASVHGAGELTYLNDAIYQVGGLDSGQLFTEKVVEFSPDQIKKIASIYSKNLWALSPDCKFISDKMPANFLYIGLIHLAFPNAKIIHAMRDPIDTCFSCYARLFNDTMDIAYDLETLGRYYVMYRKVMAHWQKVLPAGTILDLSYEDMVADSEGQTRRILEYVGLPWDSKCLDFYKNERLVKTASLAQVNKPIYKTSVERWRNFAQHLHPLIELVKDYRSPEVYPIPAPSSVLTNLAPSPVGFFDDLVSHCLGLQGRDQHEEVLQVLASHLNPDLDNQHLWHLAGISLYRLLRFQESKSCYEKALTLNPDSPMVLNSYGFLLQDMGMMQEALAAYDKAIEIAPEFAMARFNLSTAQLKLGNFEAGWQNYESRWYGSAEASNHNLEIPKTPLPKWVGQSGTENQSLLILTEQGFGDTFQFCRYLPLLTQRFRKVGFVCSMPTMRLMEWAYGNNIAIFNRIPDNYATWDWQTNLLSLPLGFQTRIETIPRNIPYLAVPAVMKRHWNERIEATGISGLRVGIAWAGRNTHLADSRRSIHFEKLLPLLDLRNISWFSLQKWTPGDVRPAIPPGVNWVDWSDEFIDFADTAGLMSNLDLIISIDSAPVHLGGALNIPVWLLNRFDGEWRWLENRTDTPWYPSLRLFNQPQFGDWDAVINSVSQELQKLTVPTRQRALQQAGVLPIQKNTANPEQLGQNLTLEQAMQLATQLQASGKLADAEQILGHILNANPRQAQALHLYAIMMHQAGQAQRATELLEQAIASDPNNDLFLSNATEILRQYRLLDQAIAFGKQAVASNPLSASAFSNLGVALFDANRLDEAQESHLKAINIDPQLVQSLNNLGSIERARKNLPQAIEWYKKVLLIDPHFIETLSNLGAVLVESDRGEEAVAPLEKALEIDGNYAVAICNLGLARIKQERYQEAISLLQRSLQLSPGYAEALIGLARAYFENEQHEQALAILIDVTNTDSQRADAYCLMGSIYTEQGKSVLAQDYFNKVLAIDVDNVTALTGIGNIKMEQGDFTEAKTLFLKAAELDPYNIEARFYLTQVEKVKEDDPNIAVLENLLSTQTNLSVDKQISLHYALGKAYDDLKRYDEAFPRFSEGARLKRSKIQFDSAADAQLTDGIIGATSAQSLQKMQGGGDPSKAPIFILGMPRSGTTLVEQIIASHPDVYGAGELDYLIQIVQQVTPSLGGKGFPADLTNLSATLLTQYGREYIASISALAPSAKHITDKMPANYLLMGLIPLMLPNAKIIHVKRDPIDTCLSCFTRLFNRHQSATYNLEELGLHYQNYLKLMEHWRNVMPADQFIEVQYEDLVNDIETQAKRLIQYCQLRWDKRCLDFYKNERAIRTASVTQVRQPVYHSSVQRWKNYEQFLKPLSNILRS
jgi:tetratricopeptide (TPR) repeat protein